jgi:dephospho-CoA kinase
MKNFDVGLTGLAGSGKDTSANFLCSQYFYSRVSFASPLKDACYALGWDGIKDERGRKLLQDVGMSFRLYDDLTWIKHMAKTLNPAYRYVFTDVRFKNEAEYIKKERNGIIIRVVRSALNLQEMHSHISESGQSDIVSDYMVMNNGSIEFLNNQLREIIESHASKIR